MSASGMTLARNGADIFGGFVAIVGVLIMVAGCSMLASAPAVLLGAAMIVIGWLISRESTLKVCPQCAEKVKVEALKCKHCGNEFAAPLTMEKEKRE
jgi:hypothetical protein